MRIVITTIVLIKIVLITIVLITIVLITIITIIQKRRKVAKHALDHLIITTTITILVILVIIIVVIIIIIIIQNMRSMFSRAGTHCVLSPLSRSDWGGRPEHNNCYY